MVVKFAAERQISPTYAAEGRFTYIRMVFPDIYIYIGGLGGASTVYPPPHNREIDFDFDSFVRARRSCAGAWEMLPDAGAPNEKFSACCSWSVGMFSV